MPPSWRDCITAVMPPLFLALTDADSPMLLWLIVGGLMALGPVIRSYIGIYDWFKGAPFDAEKFVTRAEFEAARAERDTQLAATVKDIKDDLERMEKTFADIARELPDIHRALGRLEGRRPR